MRTADTGTTRIEQDGNARSVNGRTIVVVDKFTKNKYVCDTCGGVIITNDIDEGTTPSMLACKADSKCKGIMHSRFYSPAQVGDAKPTHEWFRPTREIRRAGNQAYRDYYRKGGLSLRRVDGQVVL